jgi:cobalt/nickel transport system ATP-binding protein
MDEMRTIIRVRNLGYIYPDGTKALKGIDLDIFKGESVGLIGPNGAGKSTLLLHLNGILKGQPGSIEILGMKVEEKNLVKIRQKVAIVFQQPDDQLFMPTVFDDVAFGPINMGYPENEVRRAVKRALELVGMSGYEKRSPHHLSLGEKKRIAIATVLSMSPEILIIDEPTSNLDPRGKWSLISVLKGLTGTKIVASHDLELVKAVCQRIIIFDQGQVIADGTTESIMADKQLLAAHGLASTDVA